MSSHGGSWPKKGKRAVLGVLMLSLVAGSVALCLKMENGDLDMGHPRDPSHRLPYQRVAHKKLGEQIATRHPGGKILLIKYEAPESLSGEPNPVDQAQMEGLKEGLNGKAVIEAVVEVSSGMEEGLSIVEEDAKKTREELAERMFTAKKMDALIERYENCDVVLSLVGIPPDYESMSFWKVKDPKKRPALFLANAYLYQLKFAFEEGFISAALAHRSVPFDPNKPMPKDEEEEFDLRFLMVTPENVMKIDRENPDFFKPDEKK